MAVELGIEKLTLKNERMIAYFISNNDSPYYKSDVFGKILQYMQQHPRNSKLRENQGKRSMIMDPVTTISKAFQILKQITEL
jgi:transcription-repair coupling factor (superfamily II helicase)